MYTGAHRAEVAASIVVGIDGSELSARAVSWACEEAGRTGRTLHLVHAIAVDTPSGGGDVCTPLEDVELAEADAGHLVEEPLEICRTEASDVHVTSCVPVGLPATILVEHSRTAQLVVVGARGRGCVLRALLGSVSSQVASRADCPVVVVQQFTAMEKAPAGVAVGVDDWPDAQASVALAFDEAAARHTRVEVVHALSHDEGQRVRQAADEVRPEDQMRSRSELLLAEALAGWTAKYPDVPVRCRAVHRGAAAALVRSSAEAELLVVGPRGSDRPEETGRLLGSVSRSVLKHASCPVAVVRTKVPVFAGGRGPTNWAR